MSERLTPVVCPYCGVGCGLLIKSSNGRYVSVEYNYEHPVNRGHLCPKPNDLSFINSPHRLRKPLKKTENGFVEISWKDAIREVATRLKEIVRDFGPNAVAFLASAKCFNEENYLLQKLARLLGTNNVDHCARLCHAPTLIGMGRVTGVGALTSTFEDIANSDVIVVWGANPAETYPILMGQYILRARKRGAKLIVVGPTKNKTAWHSDIFIQLLPGTDIVVANAIMNVIIKEGLYDREFVEKRVEGFDKLVGVVSKYTPELAESVSGAPAFLIKQAAYTMSSSRKGSLLWSMGITQHIVGYRNVLALATLAALLGWYGKPGTCVGGLRGQNNVQGSCDMGALAEFLPGYTRVTDEGGRKRIASLWGVEDLPKDVGITLPCVFREAEAGRVKAAYIMGENPVISEANSSHVVKGLSNMEFLVVQDIFLTETAEYADIVLPAAAWAEKEGSFTNSERRVQWSFKALDPPGDARPDLFIIIDLAKELGLERYFNYSGPEDVLLEINKVIPAYAGITPTRLKKRVGGIIWPCPSEDHEGTRLLHVDRFRTPTGKFTVIPVEHQPPAEVPDEEYPLILTTHRVVGVFHTNTMTGKSNSLSKRWPEAEALVNPSTANTYGVKDNEVVKLVTRRGEYVVKVRLDQGVMRGVISVPWHWGVNKLTNDALDPEAMTPETKVCACKIVKLG
ncbi:MAG: formate dehydrogenase subunit alpha [Sulfolobales archaeon]